MNDPNPMTQAPVNTAKRLPRQVYFVSGTDTDVGKTTVSAALLARAAAQGHRCFAIKPVSAGCVADDNQQLISPDAAQLQAQASVALHPDSAAPIRLHAAIAPHLAAQLEGTHLQANRIVGLLRGGLSTPASHVLIEGAGGWRVPLNARETLADVAKALQYPVILVVAIRLGCLNHALLSAEAIIRDGLTLAGWVANCTDPTQLVIEAQIDTLKALLPAPCLGVLPYDPHATAAQRAAQVRWPQEAPSHPL